jgi:hypothetical protein
LAGLLIIEAHSQVLRNPPTIIGKQSPVWHLASIPT